jgi:hypothetical protein
VIIPFGGNAGVGRQSGGVMSAGTGIGVTVEKSGEGCLVAHAAIRKKHSPSITDFMPTSCVEWAHDQDVRLIASQPMVRRQV